MIEGRSDRAAAIAVELAHLTLGSARSWEWFPCLQSTSSSWCASGSAQAASGAHVLVACWRWAQSCWDIWWKRGRDWNSLDRGIEAEA